MSKSSSMGRGMMAILAVGARHAQGHDGGTVADVAAHLEKDRSQVSRSLKGALQEGFLARTDNREYRLDWSVLADAQLVTEQRLKTDGLTALEGLAAETNEACFLGVLSGNSTVTIGEQVPASANLVGSWLGRPYPAYCSDAGQALLWDAPDDEVRTLFKTVEFVKHGPNTPSSVDDFLDRLNQARERGYSIIDEEAEPGLYSLAAPVRDFKNEVVAALQIVGPRTRVEPLRESHAVALRSWCQWLEAMVGGRATPPHQP